MTVIDCPGDGRTRGRAHGETARPRVRAALERWRTASTAYGRERVAGSGLGAAVAAAMPDLYAEMTGIAEGAGVPLPEVLAYNLMDELWWLDREAAAGGCSVAGVAGPGGALLAQNMDLPAYMDGSQLVLRVRPPGGTEALVLTSAGLVGLTGVNRAGVAVCVNTLAMLRHSTTGLPVAAVLRGALACRTRAAAARFVRDAAHASGQHYAIADPSGIEGLECSAGATVTSGRAGARVLVHTNHPLAADDLDPGAYATLRAEGRVKESRRRLAHLRSQVHDRTTEHDLRRLLADRTVPICVTPTPDGPGQTFGSALYETAPRPRAHFCLGRPDKEPWLTPGWHDPT